MARFALKALAVVALVCLVFDLAAASPTASKDDSPQQIFGTNEGEEELSSTTVAAPSSFKDKVKGFVSSVKEGASDAFESVSQSVSGTTHKLDEKRKEVVAGAKKMVTGAIDKIKNSYDSLKHGKESEEKDLSSEEHVKQAVHSEKTEK